VDAEREGELLVATVLLDGSDVVLHFARVRGDGMITRELARTAVDHVVAEGAGEIRMRSSPEWSRSVRVLSARDGGTHVIWSDGWRPQALRLTASGSTSTENVPVPHGALDAANDHDGFVQVVSSCATPSCGTSPVYARRRASFGWEIHSLPTGPTSRLGSVPSRLAERRSFGMDVGSI
jgi:hypothetical protein